MHCRVIVLDTTGTTYTSYEREETQEAKKTNPEKKKEKYSVVMWQTIHNELKKHYPPQSKTRNHEK